MGRGVLVVFGEAGANAERAATTLALIATAGLVAPLNPPPPYASASPAAIVFPGSLGTATVTASTGLQSGSATVTVTPVGDACNYW